MQQASDAMREALKGDSAASAAISDMDVDVDAAMEMASVSQKKHHASVCCLVPIWQFLQPFVRLYV